MDGTIEATVADYLQSEGLLAEPVSDLTPSTPLITSGLLDSMATLELLTFLEERYSVEFEAHELTPDYIDTMAAIASLVEQKQGGA